MEIEFFHDVICSFCFPMSYRMRKIQEKYPEIKIVHRSFALVKEVTDFNLMFGSREAAKAEIMTHWQHANQNDELHRFNISGMAATDFLFPSSMNGLVATKSAEILAGTDAYWQLFDELQSELFEKNNNIEELDIIRKAVIKIGLDVTKWQKIFDSSEASALVNDDFKMGQAYGINSAPFLVFNKKYGLSGAQSFETIEQTILTLLAEESKELTMVEPQAGGSCKIVDGNYQCD